MYKQMRGPVSAEEQRILDGLSGLIEVGEVLLEQLLDVYQTRSQYQRIKFANQYELGSFLLSQPLPHGIEMGSLEILLKFLTGTDHNNRKQLAPVMRKLEESRWYSSPLAQEGKDARRKASLSILVMEAILALADDEMVPTAEEGQLDPDIGKFKSMAGIIILLDELFPPPLPVWITKLFQGDMHPDRSRECTKWLNTRNMHEIFEDKWHPSSDERKALDAPWRWFLNQQSHVIKLAFRVSRMGVLPDLTQFMHLRGVVLKELPGSSRVPVPRLVQRAETLSHRPQ